MNDLETRNTVRMRKYHNTIRRMIKQHASRPVSGVEVGVDRGELSVHLLKAFPNLNLVLVDPWHYFPPRSEFRRKGSNKEMSQRTQEEWDEVFNDVLELVEPYRDRVSILRHTSVDAAKVAEGPFDFVYIDACHTYFHVKQDIELWLPKTKKLIFGHDYGWNYPGVRKAVDEAFGQDIIINKKHKLWGHVIK